VQELVQAGCEPTPFMRAAMLDDDMKPKTVGDMYREPAIAVTKAWFAEKVVPWFEVSTGQNVYLPKWYSAPKEFQGSLGDLRFYNPDPTEAFVQCLEALVLAVAGEVG